MSRPPNPVAPHSVASGASRVRRRWRSRAPSDSRTWEVSFHIGGPFPPPGTSVERNRLLGHYASPALPLHTVSSEALSGAATGHPPLVGAPSLGARCARLLKGNDHNHSRRTDDQADEAGHYDSASSSAPGDCDSHLLHPYARVSNAGMHGTRSPSHHRHQAGPCKR